MSSEEGASTLHKINVHILTRFIAVTILSYLDRTNLAFAAIQLNQQLGFTDYIYGLGSSVFFISYSLCQVTAPGSLQCVPGAGLQRCCLQFVTSSFSLLADPQQPGTDQVRNEIPAQLEALWLLFGKSGTQLCRFGAPTWLAVIMGIWGAVATAFAALRTPAQFYVLRLLLGAAEAGRCLTPQCQPVPALPCSKSLGPATSRCALQSAWSLHSRLR